MRTITGWVEDFNVFGFRVGPFWVSRAEGGAERPRPGDYAEVEIDPEGYAVRVTIRAWRPAAPSRN